MENRASSLKAWIYPKRSGIRIREILNSHAGAAFGGSYQVTVPAKLTGRLRARKQFKTKVDAEAWADEQFRGANKQGQDFFVLTDHERREVAATIQTVRKHGVTISEAVGFALKRMPAAGKGRAIKGVVAELIHSKEQRFARGDLREASLRDFKQRAGRFAEDFEGKHLEAVTGQDLKTWLNGLELGSRSNRNYLSVIGEVYRYAVQKKYVPQSPIDEFTDVDRKELCGREDEQSEPNILVPAQAESLLIAAAANPDLRLLGAVTLALFCGLRTEELKRIDWQSVRLGEPQPFVTIDAKIAKKRRIRHVEIPANAQRWLSLCLNRKGAVAGNAHINDYQKRFLKLQRAAGLGKTDEAGKWESTWESNAMRHSFGSYHYALHGDPLATSRLLGHKASDQVLFDHYRALATKAQAEAYFAIIPAPVAAKLVNFA